MKITIVGLGIIGGSYAKGLSMKGYEVYGVDRDVETIKYAVENGFIKHGETTPENLIPIADLVVIGLYPNAIIPFLKENKDLFKKYKECRAYEEAFKLKEEGLTVKAIGERYGLTYEQTH